MLRRQREPAAAAGGETPPTTAGAAAATAREAAAATAGGETPTWALGDEIPVAGGETTRPQVVRQRRLSAQQLSELSLWWPPVERR